jgi:putative DNA primase/helicase
VQCGDIDLEALAEVRDQLWAEADQRYRSGEPWWPQDADRELFEDEQDARADADVWESLIQAYLFDQLKQALPDARRNVFVTGADIMRGALGMDPGAMRKPEQTRLGIIVQALGWRSCRPTLEHGRVRGYRPGREALEAYAKGRATGGCDEPAF